MRISHRISFIVEEHNQDIRLDVAISHHEEIESRSQATRLIDLGCVSFEGQPVKASRKTSVGELYTIDIPMREATDIVPYEIDLDIPYEDEHLLVVNKRSGLVVHPSAGHYDDTLVNALVHHSKSLSKGFEAERPGLVHRIDKDTSGLLVVAKDDSTQRHLASQFKHKTVERTYRAVCYGVPRDNQGKISSYLKRHPQNRKKFSSEILKANDTPTGKLAITKFQVVKTHNSGLSFFELKLETGRTHQIRIHLSEMGHCIVGDPIYGSKGRSKNLKGAKNQQLAASAPHLMLHAMSLGFVHPKTKERLSFSVDWPEECRDFLSHFGFTDD